MDRYLFTYPGIKPILLLETLLILAQSCAIILQAKWLAEAISALFAGKTVSSQYGTFFFFLVALLVRHLLGVLQQKLAYRFAEKTGSTLRMQLMEKLFALGPRFAKTAGTGNLVTLVLEGIAQFRTYLELIIPRMIATGITPALILLYIATQDMISAVVLVLTLPILIIFLILLGLAARKQMEQQWQRYRILSNHFVDSLRGLETLRFLGLSRSHQKSIEHVSDQYRQATLRTLRLAFLSTFALDFFTMLSVATVAVGLGLRQINGTLELLPALTVLILAPEYFLPVRMVGADYHATLQGKEAGAAISAIIGRSDDLANHQSGSSEQGIAQKWSATATLTLTGVDVRHEDKDNSLYSLQQASFQITGHMKVGIVGESGAGKSTLIDILGGFLRPTAGVIVYSGHTCHSLAKENWRQQITYIPQSPYIFAGTLADNVRFYQPDASADDVDKAIRAAGLCELVNSLPNGSDELIGNGGRPLSGGQEQRVALARSFLSGRPIMLLDEPTAHLDIETEYDLKQTMLSLFADKLVFLATHRLHWMADMDLVIVMEKGQIVEMGTHEELLEKRGAYHSLLLAQREAID